MGRNSPVSAEVVRLVFTLKNDNGWNLSWISAHFGKSKTWASQGLTRYSPESLSPDITQNWRSGRDCWPGKAFSQRSPPPSPVIKPTKSTLWKNGSPSFYLMKYGITFKILESFSPVKFFWTCNQSPRPLGGGHYLLPHPLLRDCSEATFCHKIFCQVLNELSSSP